LSVTGRGFAAVTALAISALHEDKHNTQGQLWHHRPHVCGSMGLGCLQLYIAASILSTVRFAKHSLATTATTIQMAGLGEVH
jgi:hypothetical protein